jgi:carbamoylphosphate synthase large subunit
VTLSGFQFVATNREALTSAFRLPPLPPRETIDLASDKWRLFKLAREHDLPLLPSEALTTQVIDAIRSGTSDLRLPVLVKSRQRRGGAGFQKLVSPEELDSFGSRITDSDRDEYLVQPFIQGRDYSLSVFCEKGVIKAYTLWRALAYGGRQYTIPRVIQFVEHDGILSAGRKLMAILEWEGVCDIDFFMDEEAEHFWLLEVNARFWQTVSAAAAAGVNFPVLCCEAATATRAFHWPSQKDGLCYSRPSGVPALLTMRDTRLRGSLDILRNTGLGEILRDPLPEIATLLNRAARRRVLPD